MRHTLRFWGQMIEPAGLHPFLPSTMLVLAIFHSSFIAAEAIRKASVYFTYRPFGVEPPRARQKQPQNDTKSIRTTQWMTLGRVLLDTCEATGCHSSNRAHKKSVRRGFSFFSPCCPLTFVPAGPPLCHVLIFRTAVMRRQIIPSIPIPVTCANRHGDLDDCTAGCGFAGGRHDVVSACCRRVVSDGGGSKFAAPLFPSNIDQRQQLSCFWALYVQSRCKKHPSAVRTSVLSLSSFFLPSSSFDPGVDQHEKLWNNRAKCPPCLPQCKARIGIV